MLPFEFVVEGPPVFQQTRRQERRRRWQNVVADAARQFWPSRSRTSIEGVPADVDNIPKPILDAMKGLVYVDDGQITDLVTRRRPLQGPYTVEAVTRELALALGRGREFLRVRIAAPPAGGELIDR